MTHDDPERAREYRRAYRARRKAMGLCMECPNPASPNRVKCAACRDKYRKQLTCGDCGVPVGMRRSYCDACRDRREMDERARNRVRQAARLKADPAIRARKNKHARRRMAEKIAAGICGRSGCHAPVEEGKSRCRPCLDKANADAQARYHRKKEMA